MINDLFKIIVSGYSREILYVLRNMITQFTPDILLFLLKYDFCQCSHTSYSVSMITKNIFEGSQDQQCINNSCLAEKFDLSSGGLIEILDFNLSLKVNLYNLRSRFVFFS